MDQFTILEDISEPVQEEYNNMVNVYGNSINPYESVSPNQYSGTIRNRVPQQAVMDMDERNLLMSAGVMAPDPRNDPRNDPQYQQYLQKIQMDKKRAYDEHMAKMDCKKAQAHVEGCPICREYSKCNDKYYWVIIMMLVVVILLKSRKRR